MSEAYWFEERVRQEARRRWWSGTLAELPLSEAVTSALGLPRRPQTLEELTAEVRAELLAEDAERARLAAATERGRRRVHEHQRPPERLLPAPSVVPAAPARNPATGSATGAALNKMGLIAALRDRWPNIEADLNEAKANGLSAARVPGRRGWYYEGTALDWARSNGRLAPAIGGRHVHRIS